MTAQNNQLVSSPEYVRTTSYMWITYAIPDLSPVFQSSSHYNHNHSKAHEVRTYYCEYINPLPIIIFLSDRMRRSQQKALLEEEESLTLLDDDLQHVLHVLFLFLHQQYSNRKTRATNSNSITHTHTGPRVGSVI